MRTIQRTTFRREHHRWQRCGPGRSVLRRVLVRGTTVTLGPSDARQMDLLATRTAAPGSPTPRRKAAGRAIAPAPKPALRSYWRRQPHGPGGRLRKLVLIDVRA